MTVYLRIHLVKSFLLVTLDIRKSRTVDSRIGESLFTLLPPALLQSLKSRKSVKVHFIYFVLFVVFVIIFSQIYIILFFVFDCIPFLNVEGLCIQCLLQNYDQPENNLMRKEELMY